MNPERLEPVLSLLDDRPFYRTPIIRVVWGAAGILLLTLATYLWPASTNGFFWQDQPTLNAITSWFSLSHVWTHASGTYRPLALTLMGLERRGFGLWALPYHCVSVLLHAGNAIMLWLILRRLDVKGAWLGAVVFAVHPVEAQSVAWIVQQPRLLCGLFYLLSVWSYLRWLQVYPIDAEIAELEPIPHQLHRDYVLALGTFVAALLSDPTAISLPLVLLLLMWWKKGRTPASPWAAVTPFFAIAVLGTGVNVLLYHPETLRTVIAAPLPALQRIEIAGQAIGFYAINLLRFYPAAWIHTHWNPGTGIVSAMPLLLIVGALVIEWIGRGIWGRGPMVITLIFVVLLLPNVLITLVPSAPTIYVADWQEYLASAVPLALAATGLMGVATWLSSSMSPRMARAVVGSGAIALLAAFAVAQAFAYHEADRAFKAIVARQPENVIARAQYAVFLSDDEPVNALKVLDGAGHDQDSNLSLLDARGRVYLSLGHEHDALMSYLMAQRLAPDHPRVRLGLARAYDAAGVAAMAGGHRDEAFEDFDSALAAYGAARHLNPKDETVYDGIGQVLLHEGRFAESLEQFDFAIQLDPVFVPPHVHKAQAIFNAKTGDDADRASLTRAQLREALRIDPFNVEALCTAAEIQFQSRNFAAAESACRSAIESDPLSARAWIELGFAQSAQNHFEDAVRSFEHALTLRSDAPRALRGKQLAQAQLAMGNQ